MPQRLAHYFHPQSHGLGRLGHERALVASVAPDELQVGGAGFGQDGAGPDQLLDRSRLYLHGQRQALGVHHDIALTPSYWLARVVAVTAPLLPPVRTDGVSMAPAVVSAARFDWRTAWRRPFRSRSQAGLGLVEKGVEQLPFRMARRAAIATGGHVGYH